MSAETDHKRDIDHEDPHAIKKHKSDTQESHNNGHHHIHEAAKDADQHAEHAATKPVLFWDKYTCATIVMQALNELGALDQWTLIKEDLHSEKKSDTLLSLNPLGTLPTVKLPDGTVILESGALALWVVEKYGGEHHALLGTPAQKAKLYQWLWYCPATLYPPMAIMHTSKDDAVKATTKERLAKILNYIESELGDKNWILGDNFTIADMHLSYNLWGLTFFDILPAYPKLTAYLARATERDSFKAVRALEA